MKELTTKRLCLRPFQITDLSNFYDYARQENVGIHAGWPKHENIEMTKKILSSFISKQEVFAIVHLNDDKVIGSIGLHEENKRACRASSLGYVLHPHYQGQGLMTEASQAIIKYAFQDLQLDMITATHFSENMNSKRVLIKCNFHYEGCLRQKSLLYNGQIVDLHIYSLTKEEWGK